MNSSFDKETFKQARAELCQAQGKPRLVGPFLVFTYVDWNCQSSLLIKLLCSEFVDL